MGTNVNVAVLLGERSAVDARVANTHGCAPLVGYVKFALNNSRDNSGLWLYGKRIIEAVAVKAVA